MHYPQKKVAILNDKSAYGVMIASTVQQRLNQAGTKEVLFDSFSSGEKDYSAVVTLLKQKNADVIVIGGYHTEIGLIARQLREQKDTAVLFGGMTLMTSEFWSIAGAAGNNTFMTFGPDPLTQPQAQEAIKELRKSGYDSEGYTIYSYAAVQALAQAIATARTANSIDVAAAMHKGAFSTAIGNIQFDDIGDIVKPVLVMFEWRDGKYSQVN